MIDARTESLLRQVLRFELRSLLQYLAESFPWTTPENEPAVVALQRMASETREAAAKVIGYLRRHHKDLPYLGAFPMDFTNINFIGLDYALRRLAADEQHLVAMLATNLAALADPGAQDLVQDLLTLEQNHLKELQEFAGHVPATTMM